MGGLLAIVSASAAARLREAERWLEDRPPAAEALVVAPSREAADDFVRQLAVRRGALLAVQRASVAELLIKLSSAALASRGLAPATGLGLEALAVRVVAQARAARELEFVGSSASQPRFPHALLNTLRELRLAGIDFGDLANAPRTGPDLSHLARRYEEALMSAGVADRPLLLSFARGELDARPAPALVAGKLVVALDVSMASRLEQAFWEAMAAATRQLVVTVPDGDARTSGGLERLGVQRRAAAPAHEVPPALARVQRTLGGANGSIALPPNEPDAGVETFSAPGEGREAIEIARRVLREAGRGVPFDRMAVLVRAAGAYAGLLETAFNRAGVPAWFARGTQRPHRAGRAFLALISCAVERLSASRFAEYLSLGQVPLPVDPETPRPWVAADDEVILPPTVTPPPPPTVSSAPTAQPTSVVPAQDPARPGASSADDHTAQQAGDRACRPTGDDAAPSAAADGPAPAAPWKWERLLNDAAVIGGVDRWRRRLDGLAREFEIGIEEASREDPDGPRVRALRRDRRDLEHLRAFALPIVEQLASWPDRAPWPEWIERLEALAPAALAQPERVLAVIAGARAMDALGAVTLAEIRDVLRDRLSELQVPPPPTRFGQVFVGTPEDARGRTFDVVFVPGLAERVFPAQVREDPLLLDGARDCIDRDERARLLTRTHDRLMDERLRLRLAMGAATGRVYVSFPSMDAASARERLPSLYLLDLCRALTGTLPDHETIERKAAAASGAKLAWPAPPDPAFAIDAVEHDLAALWRLLQAANPADRKGRARYLLEVHPALARSLRSRYLRGRRAWSPHDGSVFVDDDRARLQPFRLAARPYSVSALQRFAACPYRFYLASILRLEPQSTAVASSTLDPLTRGSLMHETIASCTRRLREECAYPRSVPELPRAFATLDAVLGEVAARYYDDLAPAVERIWQEEIAAIRADLRGWLTHIADSGESWEPAFVEVGFGFAPGPGRDSRSQREPVTLAGGWQLHGVVDLIERRPDGPGLRITDYKTGRNPVREGTVVGGGDTLQPVLYGLAVESALGEPVNESRLWFCTTAARYTTRVVTLTPDAVNARAAGREVLEIIDRAIELGFLPPAPREHACAHCDFHAVCGPNEERRVQYKDRGALGDLLSLRSMR